MDVFFAGKRQTSLTACCMIININMYFELAEGTI